MIEVIKRKCMIIDCFEEAERGQKFCIKKHPWLNDYGPDAKATAEQHKRTRHWRKER